MNESNDTFKRVTKIDVNKRSIYVERSPTHPTIGKMWTKWTFDLSKLSDEQVYEMATRSIVIDYQRLFRELPESDAKKMATAKFDVSELFVKRERTTLTPEETIKRAAKKLTPEQTAELLKDLGITK